MKLLFDQNISRKLPLRISDIFDSAHVSEFRLESSLDKKIWEFAQKEGYTIVTQDADFYDYGMISGFPPKIIWLRLGNISTAELERVFRKKEDEIKHFLSFPDLFCYQIQSS